MNLYQAALDSKLTNNHNNKNINKVVSFVDKEIDVPLSFSSTWQAGVK